MGPGVRAGHQRRLDRAVLQTQRVQAEQAEQAVDKAREQHVLHRHRLIEVGVVGGAVDHTEQLQRPGHRVAHTRVEGDGPGDDVEGVDAVVGAERAVAVAEVVDQGAVHVGRDEDHVADAVLRDEGEQLGALVGVAFVAVAGKERAELHHRLGQQDELPGDALGLRGEQIGLELLQLRGAEHGAPGLVGRGEIAQQPERVEVGRICDLQVAERARVDDEERRVVAVAAAAVELAPARGARVRALGVEGLARGVVVDKGLQRRAEQRRLVDVRALLAGEERAGRRRRAAGEVVADLVVVDGREPGGRGAGVGQGVQARTGAVDLAVLGAELRRRLALRAGHVGRGDVGVDRVAEVDEEVEVARGDVADGGERGQVAAVVARDAEAHAVVAGGVWRAEPAMGPSAAGAARAVGVGRAGLQALQLGLGRQRRIVDVQRDAAVPATRRVLAAALVGADGADLECHLAGGGGAGPEHGAGGGHVTGCDAVGHRWLGRPLGCRRVEDLVAGGGPDEVPSQRVADVREVDVEQGRAHARQLAERLRLRATLVHGREQVDRAHTVGVGDLLDGLAHLQGDGVGRWCEQRVGVVRLERDDGGARRGSPQGAEDGVHVLPHREQGRRQLRLDAADVEVAGAEQAVDVVGAHRHDDRRDLPRMRLQEGERRGELGAAVGDVQRMALVLVGAGACAHRAGRLTRARQVDDRGVLADGGGVESVGEPVGHAGVGILGQIADQEAIVAGAEGHRVAEHQGVGLGRREWRLGRRPGVGSSDQHEEPGEQPTRSRPRCARRHLPLPGDVQVRTIRRQIASLATSTQANCPKNPQQ